MRALVTGGAGFIGSSLTRRLVNDGWDVRVFDSLVTASADNVPPGAEFVHGDVRRSELVSAACGDVDIVFHQAGLDSVARSLEDPVETHRCNAEGTLNVLIAAEEQGVRRVVNASSVSVYGNVGSESNHEELMTRPLSPFAVSNLAAEHYCRVWTLVKGLPTVSLRYFNVFGPGQGLDRDRGPVVPSFIAAVAEVRPPVVHGDGEQSRDFVYVDDVVEANLLAAESDSRVDGEVVNIGSGTSRRIKDVLESISEVMNASVEPMFGEAWSGDIDHTKADISKAVGLLGWQPTTAWQDAIKITAEWYVDRLTPRSKR